jgi:hypothetical protein
MAGSTGLEPAASGVTGRRSNQLNYDPEQRNTTQIDDPPAVTLDGICDVRWRLGSARLPSRSSPT